MGQAGVFGDHGGGHASELQVGGIDAAAHALVVGQVVLEEQPKGTVGILDEAEVGAGPGCDAFSVVVGVGECLACCGEQVFDGDVEKVEIEVELAGEVLVENRLGDSGPVGDVIHGCRVVADGGEDLQGGGQDLLTALLAGKARGARAVRRGHPRTVRLPRRRVTGSHGPGSGLTLHG